MSSMLGSRLTNSTIRATVMKGPKKMAPMIEKAFIILINAGVSISMFLYSHHSLNSHPSFRPTCRPRKMSHGWDIAKAPTFKQNRAVLNRCGVSRRVRDLLSPYRDLISASRMEAKPVEVIK